MITKLVKIEDANEQLSQGEQAYAFETSDGKTMLGPACGFGSNYLGHLRTEGRYAESFEEANQTVQARGASITGIWFVKQPMPADGDK